MAEIRKARTRHQAYIARANHGNPHEITCSLWLTIAEICASLLKHLAAKGKTGKARETGMSFV
jgi:hypothetical protein